MQNKMRIAFVLFLAFVAQSAICQDSAKAFQFWYERNMPFAKDAVDEWSNGEGSEKANCWLLKARVYNELKAIGSDLVADPLTEAYNSLKRAYSLDATYVKEEMALEGNLLPKSIYSSLISDAVSSYNGGIEAKNKQHFENALKLFQKAFFINAGLQRLSLLPQALDTINTYHAARAAIKAGKENDAVGYCKKITGQQAVNASNTSLEPAWQWLLLFYLKNKQEGDFFSLADKYQEKFPNSLYSYNARIDWFKSLKDHSGALKAYDFAVSRFPQKIKPAAMAFANKLITKKIPCTDAVRAEARMLLNKMKGLKV